MGISHDPNRPCTHPGCNSTGQYTGIKNGRKVYRNLCYKHHGERIAKKHGVKSIAHVIAKNAGYDRVADWKNSYHRYRKHRKDYCENIDGRLGYVCTATIPGVWVLDVDHKDGNPDNNCPTNLQTLCKVCHAHKTITAEDWKSPGRKTLGIK